MKFADIRVVAAVICLIFTVSAQAQETSGQTAKAAGPSSQEIVPRLVKFGGTLLDAENRPMSQEPLGVTFALYAQQTGGAALWMETQNVRPETDGSYNVLLGAESAKGIPAELFASGEARWLGIEIERQSEQPRLGQSKFTLKMEA
jgi:hypothetical protein